MASQLAGLHMAVFHNLPSGGALKALGQKIRLFLERGAHVSIYSFATADHDFLSLSAGLLTQSIEPLEGNTHTVKIPDYFSAARRLAEKIEKSSADVVFVDKCRYFGSPTILQHLKKPTVFYSHEPLRIKEYEILAESSSHPLRDIASSTNPYTVSNVLQKLSTIPYRIQIKREDKKSIQAARMVMTNSHFTASWLKRVYGVSSEVNYQGVDTSFFMPDSSRLKSNQILSVGRMEAVKGYDFLLNVLSGIPKETRPAWIIVADSMDPFFAEKFKREARRLGVLYDIRSRISEEELRDLYQISSSVLCASYREPFGLVPLEAMACETPVIAVNEGGYRESIRHERTGLLLERNIKVWQTKLSEVLFNPHQLLEWGRAGRNHVMNHWTWQSFGDRFEKSLMGLLRDYAAKRS